MMQMMWTRMMRTKMRRTRMIEMMIETSQTSLHPVPKGTGRIDTPNESPRIYNQEYRCPTQLP